MLSQHDVMALLTSLADLGLRAGNAVIPQWLTPHTFESTASPNPEGDEALVTPEGGLAPLTAVVHDLLHTIVTAHHGGHSSALAEASPASLAALLRSLLSLGVSPEGSFLAAVQRELKGRLVTGGLGAVTPRVFCTFAEGVAAFGYKVDQELLDSFLEAAEPHLDRLSGEYSWWRRNCIYYVLVYTQVYKQHTCVNISIQG